MLGARAGLSFRRVIALMVRHPLHRRAGAGAETHRRVGRSEKQGKGSTRAGGNLSTATPSALCYFCHRLATKHSNPKQPTDANTLNITPGVHGDLISAANLFTAGAGQEEVLSRHSMSVQHDSAGVGTARKVVVC